MRVVRAISPDEVTSTFLRGDLESPRFREPLLGLLTEDGVDPSVIAAPDLVDSAANDYRRGLLGRHRTWLKGPHVFGAFPGSLDWHSVALTPEEVTAYALFPERLADELEVLLGVAERVDGWSIY